MTHPDNVEMTFSNGTRYVMPRADAEAAEREARIQRAMAFFDIDRQDAERVVRAFEGHGVA